MTSTSTSKIKKSIIAALGAACLATGVIAWSAPAEAAFGGGMGGGGFHGGMGGGFHGGGMGGHFGGGHFAAGHFAPRVAVHNRFAIHNRFVNNRVVVRDRFVFRDRFAFRHHFFPFRHRFAAVSFVADSCVRFLHVWTPVGWAWRRVWVCG
jgi:hypothetical protein